MLPFSFAANSENWRTLPAFFSLAFHNELERINADRRAKMALILLSRA